MPTDPTDHVINQAIEDALWQDLADALNRLGEWGVNPLLAVADRLGTHAVVELDPLDRDRMLRYRPPFTPDPQRPGENLPFGWHVVPRTPA